MSSPAEPPAPGPAAADGPEPGGAADGSDDHPTRRRDARLVVLVLAAVLVPLALLALVLVGSDDEGEPSGSSGGFSSSVEVGEPVPEFTLRSLDGTEHSLADLRGRPVLVNFWASWCSPCRKEFPLLDEIHRDGTAVVLAVIYNDLEADARRFIEETGAAFPALVDPEGDVARSFGIAGIPQTFLVDGDGVLRDRLFGIARRADLEDPLREVTGT